jgi:hypothetical protein
VNHSVFVTYVFAQEPLPKTLTFKHEEEVGELARQSETSEPVTFLTSLEFVAEKLPRASA